MILKGSMIKIRNIKPAKSPVQFFIIDKDTNFANKISRNLNRDPDYEIHTYTDIESFLSQYHKKSRKKEEINIIIIASNQLKEEDGSLFQRIKKINKYAEIILLNEEDSTESISNALDYGVYSLIKKNENALFRIENAAKGIKSMKRFLTKKREVRRYLIIFFAFTLLMLLFLLIFKTTLFESSLS